MPLRHASAAPPAGDPLTAEQALRLQLGRLTEAQARAALRTDRQRQAIAALSARLRDSDALAAQLAAERAQLRIEVAALRGSTSWRITAPLRALRRGWDRIRGQAFRG